MSRVMARTIRRDSVELQRDFVLHGIGRSTFREYWNFNVLEMTIKTIHFVPGLSMTPLLFILRYHTNIFPRTYFQEKHKIENWKSGNLKFRKYLHSIILESEVQGSQSGLSAPRNREIGFVSSSFSFRACRASGRGEAARAHVDRCPYRWASRALGSTWCSGPLFADLLCTGAWVVTAFGTVCNLFVYFVLLCAWVLRFE